MNKKTDLSKKPTIPEENAVRRLRERFQERKSNIKPSAEMDEIVRKKPGTEKEPVRKIAKPKRNPDIDLT